MSVNVTGSFVYFIIPIFGGIPITQTTVSSLIVTVILCFAFVKLGKNLSTHPGKAQVLVEKGVGMIQNLVVESMGPENACWTPFIGAVFLSSILGSLIGMTGFLRSSTADLSTTLTWSLMVSVIIWYNNIKNNGFVGWLKGFTEPIVVMTPMNIVGEIAQPASMAFRHFGNVAGGGVITSVLYTGLSLASSVLLNLIASNGVAIGIVLAVLGAGLLVWHHRTKKVSSMIFGLLSLALGIFGILQAADVLTGVPILTLGIPAVLSLYFDVFSGFVQALVFSLLTMVYISGSLPEPQPAAEQ